MPRTITQRCRVTKQPKAIVTPYQYVNADWKDFPGFTEELVRTLNRMGLYACEDISFAGSDQIGIIISKTPIDPKEYYLEQRQMMIELEGEEEDDSPEDYLEWKELFKQAIRNASPYVMGDTIVLKHKNYPKVQWKIVGWQYDLLAERYVYTIRPKRKSAKPTLIVGLSAISHKVYS